MRRALVTLLLLASTLEPQTGRADVPAVDAGTTAMIADDAASPATIAVEAYVYAYPLVLMELTRRVQTNAGDGAPATVARSTLPRAPMNQFAHQRVFPAAGAEDVLRPNVDVLVSSLWFDVGTEPLVIDIPDAASRYYAMPMLDLWSDVFAALGPRTSGGGAQTVALTTRGFTGMLPNGVTKIEAPTDVGLVTARILVGGAKDLDAVHRFQDGFKATPLSQWAKPPTPPPPATFDPARDMDLPRNQILRLPSARFFALFAELTAKNPPHANDYPILQRLARIGLVPGKPFVVDQLAPEVRAALPQTPITAGQALFENFKRAGTRVNGWRTLGSPLGAYATDYRRRQVVAYSAFGADLLEDTLFFNTIADADGKPLEGSQRYTLHFPAAELPPAHAAWSVTLYDEGQLLAPVATKRVTLGDRSGLTKNPDGSLDLFVQAASPGADKAANWLPTPQAGRFTLTLRLYWPKPVALGGFWVPPALAATK